MARGPAGYVLGLTSTKSKLEPKSAYPVRLVAGEQIDREAQAEVSNENTVTIRLGADQGLIDQLKGMDALDVRVASGTIRVTSSTKGRKRSASSTPAGATTRGSP